MAPRTDRTRTRWTLAATLAVALLLAGCTTAAPDDGGAATQTDDGDDHADGPVHVDMVEIKFEPKTIEVPVGTTVTWENHDAVIHTVTADDGSFDSGDLDPDETWSYTFDAPGTYPYYCEPHAYQDDDGTWKGMVGTVVVEA